MFLEDEPVPSGDRKALTPELLEQYNSERQRLAAQARELERLRQQVRNSAEREAAAIVTTARRNVRQVLVDARRELLVLVAQLQAVGCEAQPEDVGSRIVEGQAPTASEAAVASNLEATESESASPILTGARRDVREVLLEAQAELLALSEEARELRARIARQQEAGREAAAALAQPEPAPVAAHLEEYASEAQAEPTPAHEPEQIESAPPEMEATPPEYESLSSPSRVWVALAAALVLTAIGVGLYMSSTRRSPGRVAAAAARNAPEPAREAARTAEPGAAATPAPAALDPSLVNVRLEVRRPAWIRTTVDGRADAARLFAAGETRSLSASREVVMRAGDAGAVLVSVNGAAPKALGPDGQVMTRRFGRPPAPAPVAPEMPRTAAASETPRGLAVDTPPSDVGTTGKSEAVPAPAVTPEREILRSTQRWFEAYFGGDAAGMSAIATDDFSIVDDRADGQRLPATMRGVDRGLQQMRIEVAGESAVMSARLTERAQIKGQSHEYTALVTAAWVRTDGRWRLMGVRFADPGQDSRQRPF